MGEATLPLASMNFTRKYENGSDESIPIDSFFLGLSAGHALRRCAPVFNSRSLAFESSLDITHLLEVLPSGQRDLETHRTPSQVTRKESIRAIGT